MRFAPVKIPPLIKRIFPNYVWDFSSKDKVIYLTFDDGPTPEITTWTLEVLKQYHAKATFFCVGNNVQKHPELFQSILEDNHRIGNHTFNHIKGWKTTTEAYLESVKLTQDTISKQLGNRPNRGNLFRPPFGQIKNSQGDALIKLGYKIIMWSVITFDWEQDITQTQCLKNAISKTNKGDIVVFHDSVKASKNMSYALPEFLDYFSKKGFRFEAIDV